MEWRWTQWRHIEGQMDGSRHTLLLLDFDGTLAPIAPTPEQASLPASTKLLLRSLSQSPKATVALVSGRALADLRHLVGLRDLTYIGNHGLEMWRDGRRTVIAVPQHSRDAMDRVRPRLARLLRDVPGAYLEDKGLSVGVHHRLVQGRHEARLRAAFRREVRPFIRSGALKVVSGMKVMEVCPNLDWTKGHATLRLMKQMRRRSLLTIYIGDDRTDEDAFAMLVDGITIRVGAYRRSKARYYVRNVEEVASLLRELARLLG